MTLASAPVQAGDVLAGKYRVDRVLGQGNMGVVVAASHVDLAHRVALKFMLPGAAGQKEHRERFLREARASARLKSQHVARVLDVGTLDGDTPYIVMELLEGGDLAALLKSGPLPFPQAVEYFLQACEAVAEAHAAGIVHRDLKPANLFLTHDVGGAPCVKVLDFGISKSAGVDLTLTQDAQALGSPLYMSPEQMNSSKDVDARSDIWALGIVLYQLVAGVTPFHADSIQALCARVLMGTPTPLAELRPDAPPGFEAIVLRCLQRDREQRFSNVAQLAAALAPFTPPSAIPYLQRVARALGVAAPSSAAATPAAPAREPPSPAVAASSPHVTASTGAPAASTGAPTGAPTGTVLIASPTATGASAPAALAASATGSLAASGPPAPAPAPAALGASAVLAASAPHLGASAPHLAASAPHLAASAPAVLAASASGLALSQSAPAPAPPRTALLLLAGAGAALLLVAGLAIAFRPWASPLPVGAETAPAAAPEPTVLPAPPAPSPTASATATAAPSASAGAAVTATTAGPAAPRPPTSTRPAPRPTSAPTSKPGVSYDDRK